jgi:hypothetical protein
VSKQILKKANKNLKDAEKGYLCKSYAVRVHSYIQTPQGREVGRFVRV